MITHFSFCSMRQFSNPCFFSLAFIRIILDLWSPILPTFNTKIFALILFMPAKCAECSPEHLCLEWCWVAVGTSCSPFLVLVWALHKTFRDVGKPVINPNSIHLLLFQHQPIKLVWKYWVLVNHLLLGRCVFAIGTSLSETD